MSEQASAHADDAADKDKKKKKSGPGFSNALLVILGIVNFLAVAGVGAYLVYGMGHNAQAAAPDLPKGEGHGEAAEGEEHGEGGEGHGEAAEGDGHGGGHGAPSNASGKETGPLIALDTIVTNLSDPDSDRYLKITVQFRITSESARAEVESHLVPVRSQVLMYFSSLNLADLRGAEAKQTLQARVKRIANEAMPTSRIVQVYFTELVIQ